MNAAVAGGGATAVPPPPRRRRPAAVGVCRQMPPIDSSALPLVKTLFLCVFYEDSMHVCMNICIYVYVNMIGGKVFLCVC